MSKLEELIQKLCPNGVCILNPCASSKLVAGDRITKAMMDDLHKFPVMGRGVAPTGMYSEYNFEKCNCNI